MIKQQFNKVKNSIIPFIFIGLFLGFFIGKVSWLRSFGFVRKYLYNAQIYPNYDDCGQTLFFEYFDAKILTYILLSMFITMGLGRLVFNKINFVRGQSWLSVLEKLGSILAIAWLGIMIGMTAPILIIQGMYSAVIFLAKGIFLY